MTKAYIQGIIDVGYTNYVNPYKPGTTDHQDWLDGQESEMRYTYSYYQQHWRQLQQELLEHSQTKQPKATRPVWDMELINHCQNETLVKTPAL